MAMDWLYIDDPSEETRISHMIDSAEAQVSDDLDGTSLYEMEDGDGNIPADLVTAILIRVGQIYAAPDGMKPASVGENGMYASIIKKHARLC